MMQIVHDVAPNADPLFCDRHSAGEAAFAANIRRTLRTNPTGASPTDVIVDDVFYFDEPFYSDGQIARAVNDSRDQLGVSRRQREVSYFSIGRQSRFRRRRRLDRRPRNAGLFSATPTGLGNTSATVAQLNTQGWRSCFNFTPTGSTQADAGGGWLDFGAATSTPAVTLIGEAASSGKTIITQWDDRASTAAR